MTAIRDPERCRWCGHFQTPDVACVRCGGGAIALGDAPAVLRPGRGFPLFDFVRGLTMFARSTGQVLHHRAFVGKLKVPIAANAVACVAYAALLFVLWPVFESWFAGRWLVFDGLRAACAGRGPAALWLATAWFLWPVWFDVVAGAAVEPLAAAAERAVGGTGMDIELPAGLRAVAARLWPRARLFTLQLLALPLLWAVALVPYVGLPFDFLCAAAAAAMVWCEPPAARRGLDLRQHLGDLRRNWARALGFGAGCQIGLAVPFLNLLVLAPAAAVGASVLHFQFDKGPDPEEAT